LLVVLGKSHKIKKAEWLVLLALLVILAWPQLRLPLVEVHRNMRATAHVVLKCFWLLVKPQQIALQNAKNAATNPY
jgi:uncharacterized protein (UPF0216 family)